ncbi:MAG: hypothetical protein NTZ84_03115 [Candidatus Nealsonbacteria bacterium]|nr:hypothetical protein [Candidatus Nealsonbacteria bacterium]
MVTINQSGASGQGSELKSSPLAGRSSKTIILIAVISILILIIGIFFLKQKFGLFGQPKTGQEAQKIIIPKVLYNLAGLVQELDKNSFILEASIPQLNDSGKPIQKKETRKVNITSATRFSRLTFVSQEGETGKAPVETPMTFSDIKVGDYIEVIANQDISQALEFEASQARSLPREF